MKTKHWKYLAIALMLVIVVATAFFGINYIQDNSYKEGQQDTMTRIVRTVQEKGYIQIQTGNQTLTLVPYQPKKTQGVRNE